MAEPGSWIKLDRNILNWGWFTDKNTLTVFLWLLLKANIEPHDFKGVTIPRGSVATSYKSIASQGKMTYAEVRTAISHLKKTGEITTSIHREFIEISITNYSKYQGERTNMTRTSHEHDTNMTRTSQQLKNKRSKEGERGAQSAPRPRTYSEEMDEIIDKVWAEMEEGKK